MSGSRVRRRPREAIGIAAILAVVVVGAVGSQGASAQDDALEGELRWLTWAQGGPYTDLPVTVAERFMAAHPGVTITLDQQPAGAGFLEKLLADQATGRIADIIANESGSSQTLAQSGITLDLNPLLATDPAFPADDFYPQMLAAGESVALGGMDPGELHLLGMSVDAFTMLFNLDMLEEAGLALPEDDWTYADLVDYACQLTVRDANGNVTRWGLATSVDNADMLSAPLVAHGSPILDEATQTLDTTGFDRALEAYWGGVKDGCIISPEDVNGAFGGDWQAPFVAGQAAMLQGAIWSTPLLADVPFEWDVALMPGDVQRASPGGTAGWSITAASQNQPLAWELLKFIYSPEGYSIWTDQKSVTPPLRSLSDTDWAPDIGHPQRYLEAVESLYIQPRGPVFDAGGLWYLELQNAYNAHVIQGIPLDEVIATLKGTIDAALAEEPAALVPVPREPIEG
jgi:multiple sugar transport system substrate-binding protein